MNNDYIENLIKKRQEELRKELGAVSIKDLEGDAMRAAEAMNPLSSFSTTQLKAELRRRKRGGK